MENEKRKAKNEKQKTISEKRKAKNKKRVTKNEKQTNFSLLEKIWIYLGLLKRYIHAKRLFWYTLLLVSGQGGKPFIFFFNQSVCWIKCIGEYRLTDEKILYFFKSFVCLYASILGSVRIYMYQNFHWHLQSIEIQMICSGSSLFAFAVTESRKYNVLKLMKIQSKSQPSRPTR